MTAEPDLTRSAHSGKKRSFLNQEDLPAHLRRTSRRSLKDGTKPKKGGSKRSRKNGSRRSMKGNHGRRSMAKDKQMKKGHKNTFRAMTNQQRPMRPGTRFEMSLYMKLKK
jgi:hypothetical protein